MNAQKWHQSEHLKNIAVGGKRGMSFGGSFQGFFFTGPRKLSNSVLEKGCFNGLQCQRTPFSTWGMFILYN